MPEVFDSKNKIKLKQAVIVEGKYDKIKLSAFIDAKIIPTNGFGIFSDKETLGLIRTYAETCGIIVLTDSDSAGFVIRNHIRSTVKGNVKHAYIPEIFGKERRKKSPSKEGKLGVEGVSLKVIYDALKRCGAFEETPKTVENPITSLDFFELGLSGGQNSSALRKKLLSEINAPGKLSSKGLLELVNELFERSEFFDFVQNIQI